MTGREDAEAATDVVDALDKATRAIAGLQVIPVTPPPLPGGSNFPI